MKGKRGFADCWIDSQEYCWFTKLQSLQVPKGSPTTVALTQPSSSVHYHSIAFVVYQSVSGMGSNRTRLLPVINASFCHVNWREGYHNRFDS